MKMNTINRTDLKHPKQHWIMTDKKQRRENDTERGRKRASVLCKEMQKGSHYKYSTRSTKHQKYDNDFAKVLWQWHNTSTDSWRIQRISTRKKWHAKHRLKKTEHCLQCCSVNKNKRQRTEKHCQKKWECRMIQNTKC